MLVYRGVQVGDIRLMVLVMVQVHGGFVDVRLQRVVGVGERGDFKCHCGCDSFRCFVSRGKPVREVPFS